MRWIRALATTRWPGGSDGAASTQRVGLGRPHRLRAANRLDVLAKLGSFLSVPHLTEPVLEVIQLGDSLMV